MEISQPDVHDDVVVAELFAVRRTAHDVDDPDNPPPCSVAFPVGLRRPVSSRKTAHRVARVDGRIVGHLEIGLPTRDNLHLADISVEVHPDHRRRGIGRALMELGLELARAEGRRTVNAGAWATWQDGPPRSEAGGLFLTAMGFELALTDVGRRLDLTTVDPEVEQRLYKEAAEKSADYEIIPWTVRPPDEILPRVAELTSIFNDEAPTGTLELERENVDAARIRDRHDHVIASGIFMLGVMARDPSSGKIAGHTVIGVNTEPGDYAEQWITLVDPAHRGHRLGLRTKLENHRQLLRERPAVRWIDTGNASVNEHMIAINELLGFRPVDSWQEFQRAI